MTDLDYRSSKKYVFFPSIGLVRSDDRKRTVVENHYPLTIDIKEYSSSAFSVFRELCGISASLILQSMESDWVIGMDSIPKYCAIVNVSRKEKNRLLFLLRSFITVFNTASLHHSSSIATFMKHSFFLSFAVCFAFVLKSCTLCGMGVSYEL